MKPILRKRTTTTFPSTKNKKIKKKITIIDPKSSSPVRRKRTTPKGILRNTGRSQPIKLLPKKKKKKKPKSRLKFTAVSKLIPKLQRLLTEQEGHKEENKKKSKRKGILKIKIETYIKSNPLFKSKEIQTVLKHCRREIGFILTKLKAHLKHNNEKTLNMVGEYNLKEEKIIQLFKIWKKYIFNFFAEKQKRDFDKVFGNYKGKSHHDEDTFTWTTFLDEEQPKQKIVLKEKEEEKKEESGSQLVDIDSSSSSSFVSKDSIEEFSKIKIGFFLNEFMIFLLDFIQVRAGIYLL